MYNILKIPIKTDKSKGIRHGSNNLQLLLQKARRHLIPAVQKEKQKGDKINVNKKFIPILLSALLLTSCGHAQGGSAYRSVSMDEAKALMNTEKDYIILDVRRPDEYAEGHIPGAINVPNEQIGTSEIPKLPDKSQLILVYCRSGRRSKEASEKLVKLGYTNIVEFGGILDWKGEIEK